MYKRQQYPYFDECVLNVLPRSLNFLQMADLLRTCVARREQETNATPPSEPQVLIGEQIRPVLFAAPFRRAG